MYNVVVAGSGHFGLVTGVCLAEVGHNVICVDLDETMLQMIRFGDAPVYEPDLARLMRKNREAGRLKFTSDYGNAYRNADVIFIGVGIKENADGSMDLTNLYTVASQIVNHLEKDGIIVLKTTVPVGTADQLDDYIKAALPQDIKVEVASNPAFFAKGSAIRDTLKATKIVIGTKSKWVEDKLREVFQPFKQPVIAVTRRTAEMIKLATNGFLAMKISYLNDIANLCEKVDADILDVVHAMSYDERVGRIFLEAGIGYGGYSFIKDKNMLLHLAQENDYNLKTLLAAEEVNQEQRMALYWKARKLRINFQGLKVAILGLTYKPGTDDCRRSPAIDNIAQLLKDGANVYAYDPIGMDNFKKIYPQGEHGKGSISYVNTIEVALNDADVCFILTDWGKIKAIKTDVYRKFMKTPYVFDGRNIYDMDDMTKEGVEYVPIGRRRKPI